MASRSPAFKELDVVRLKRDLPEENLRKGERGTIVQELTTPRQAYMVEFMGNDGTTKALCTLRPTQIEKADGPE